MKEIPILFSGPMVKAILEGRKTQTRRVVKTNPSGFDVSCYSFKTRNFIKCHELEDDHCAPCGFGFQNESTFWRCPYGQPGDRLWVKETWGLCSYNDPTDWCGGSIRGVSESELREQFLVEYRQNWITHPDSAYWRPSIFMPRWASRITLEITGVRVERLNEISDFDAFQEGVKDEPGTITGPYCRSFVQGFKNIWESINGPGSWDENPWVWVIEFRRVN